MSQEALAEYIAESEEILLRVGGGLSLVEKGESSPEKMSALYRDMHTMKGSSQLFGYSEIGKVAHAMESALEPFRKKPVSPSQELADALFSGLDLIERLLACVREQRSVDAILTESVQELSSRLARALSAQFGEEPGSGEAAKVDSVAVQAPAVAPVAAPSVSAPSVPTPSAAPQSAVQTPPQGGGGEAAGDAGSYVRVHVAVLENLMAIVSEAVLVRNQLLQVASQSEDSMLQRVVHRLNYVTSELQNEVMKTRMQPIGGMLSKMQRMVRDLGKELGKKIDLEIQGGETELDRTLIEAIKDPLTHLLRNACDHGLEMPAERSKAGKPEGGRVRVSSFHEAGQVVIEIRDDGRGLDRDRILAKGIERGLVRQEEISSLPDQRIFQLIFEAGFSTAEKVTSVSGRGVGLDVVKTNVEKIGGQVQIESIKGKGAVFRIQIPLTLAIVPALIVRSHGETFAIPQEKLLEIVRAGGESAAQVERLQDQWVLRLRGKLLPLISLHDALNLGQAGAIEEGASRFVVVLQSDGLHFGLEVDEVVDSSDIVVKPLHSRLKNLKVFSGATLMGDGALALILDIFGLCKLVGIGNEAKHANDFQASVSDEALVEKNRRRDSQEYLVFQVGEEKNLVVPLALVARLEEVSRAQVDHSGAQLVLRYREQLLPILPMAKFLTTAGDMKWELPEKFYVIVAYHRGKLFGFAVDAIEDIIDSLNDPDSSLQSSRWSMGTLLSGARVYNVIDVLGVLTHEMRRLSPHESVSPADRPDGKRREASSPEPEAAARISGRVLLVEDSAFFRRQVQRMLERFGMTVESAADGKEAYDILSNSAQGFDLVLSDIEMPNMTGIELALAIRKEKKYAHLPLIALTTRTQPADVERGKQAGFDFYLEKLEEKVLSAAIQQALQSKRPSLSLSAGEVRS